MFSTIWMCTHEWSDICSRSASDARRVPPGLDLQVRANRLEQLLKALVAA
jgi:hypothetical protein